MNVVSFTLAGALRASVLIGSVMAAFIAYEHFHTKAVFERTAGQMFRAMDAQLSQTLSQTNCLQIPDNPTLIGLVNAQLLEQNIVTSSPWLLGLGYQTNANNVVVSKIVTFTALDASQEETLQSLANTQSNSWHYQSPTLTLLESVAFDDHDVMQQDRNSPSGCYGW